MLKLSTKKTQSLMKKSVLVIVIIFGIIATVQFSYDGYLASVCDTCGDIGDNNPFTNWTAFFISMFLFAVGLPVILVVLMALEDNSKQQFGKSGLQ